ncbi:hypothetical protein [Yinghuangia soli]|uniref:Uncharacterized protein n=1 Tax=Yinghuangia soli TaxID=2908204 RepID=A0AA41Q3N3_9ACTN|nr:hypothetical protein [Yinghuangia soli]MCF2530632.1 hypothetical protein [Yinghuangia soli]
MTEPYGDDLYTELPADGLDDMSLDTTLADDAGSTDLLWETAPDGIETLDAVADPALDAPAPDLPDYTDPLDVPQGGDIPTEEPPYTGTGTGDPIEPGAQQELDPYMPGAEDPYAEGTGEDPYGETGTDPYADAGSEDPYAVDPNDPNVGLDPSDPNYDHYYAEHGYPYDGPSDVSDAAVEDDNSEAPSDPLPVDDYTGYDPDAYTPTDYSYDDPFAYPGYDEGYDPYGEAGYDPYADGPYGGGYDVVYDPCWGDFGYDPYQQIFVEVNVTVEGDVYVVGDQTADVYVVDDSDTYIDNSDNSTTYVDNSTTYVDNSSDTHVDVDYTETTVVQEEVVYYEGWDGDSAPPYESYGPMEIAHYTPDWNVTDFDGVGDPLADAAYFHEAENPVNTPLVTEGQIIEKLTGTPFNEEALAAQAENAGFFDPELGMTNTDVGSLLELHGIETETVYDADMDTIMNALESGDPVMAVVDVNETGIPMRDVVTGEPIEQNPSVMGSVWVTGVDVQPDGSVYVLVNDPGWPEGQTQAIAIEDFANAWEESGNQAVIAHA